MHSWYSSDSNEIETFNNQSNDRKSWNFKSKVSNTFLWLKRKINLMICGDHRMLVISWVKPSFTAIVNLKALDSCFILFWESLGARWINWTL